MANSNKNIIITPNIGSTTADPKIQFLGGNTSVNTDISMYVYPNSNGTLSFEGSAGQLFSITNDLSGSIFSVNDVSGIPSIEVFANGQISFAPYGGNVVFGSTSSISNPYFNSDINFTNAGVTRFISTPANNSLSLRFGTTGQSGYGTGSMALSVQGGGYVRVDYSGGGTYQYDPYGSYWHMGYSGIIFNNSGGNAAASPVTFQGVNYVNATTSFRAPIFYDSDNTAYYMDLNSTSRLNVLKFASGATDGPYFNYGNNQQNLYLRGSSGSDIGISFFDNSNTWRMQLYGSAAGYGFLTSNWGLWDLQKILTGKLYLNNQTTYYIDTNEIYYNRVYGVTDIRSPIFYDNNDTAYYTDPASTSRLSILNLATYGYVAGTTLHGQSFYQWESASFRNPADHTPSFLIRQDNATTGINGFKPALALYNNNGGDQTTVGLSFVSSESTTGTPNSVTLAGIAAKKDIVGVAGGWTSGSLYFFVKELATRRDGMFIHNSGYVQSDFSFRAPIFYDSNDTSFYLDPASTTTSLQIAGAIEQGNNIARPNIEWQASGASTGMVIFSLPGASGNYGMVHMVFDVYEYVAGKIATVIIGGHNWNGNWYQTGCQVIGSLDKTVRLGFKDGKYCVVFGGAASAWDHGTIRLRKIHNGGFYNNIMDLGGAYTAAQTTTESFTAVTADLRQLRTPGTFQADGDIRTPIFYDSNNTNFYVDPASGSSIKRLFVDLTSVDPTEINGAALGNIYEVTTGWSAPGIGFGSGAGSHGAIGYNSGQMYFASENGSDNTLASRMTLTNAGILSVTTDVRAPIFYDTNNTAYYLDPASTSNMNALTVNGTLTASSSANYYSGHFYYIPYDAAGNHYPHFSDGANASGTKINWRLYLGATNSVTHTWTTAAATFVTSLVSSVDARAPIFYDQNNTAYYTDPASTSILNNLTASNINVTNLNASTIGWNSIVPVFGQRGSYINELVDVLYQADKRFTLTNGSQYYFDGDFSSSVTIPVNTTRVININIAGQAGIPANGITYCGGTILVSFYYTDNLYSSLSLRVRNYLGTWTNAAAPTDISTSASLKVMAFTVPIGNYLTDIELTVVTNATNAVNLSSINYYSTRWTTEVELPYASKYLSSNYMFGNFGVKNNTGGINNLLSGTGNSYLAASTDNVGIGTSSPSYKLHFVGQNNAAGGAAAYFDNTVNATNNGSGFLFRNQYGSHSWGIVSEYRIEGTAGTDRPSILFSTGYNTDTWSVGFGGSDSLFRINYDHGHRNAGSGWGTTAFSIDRSRNIIAYGSSRAPIFYDNDNTAYYTDPLSTSNLNTVQAADAFRSDRFEDLAGNFFFREGVTSGVTRHLNLSDSNSDPASVSSDVGISWGARSDSLPYYMIWTSNYNNGITLHSRLRLGWHTGIEIGAAATYGGTRFFDNAPGIAGTSELMSIGKSDSHVRVVNNLYSKIYYDIDNTTYYADLASTPSIVIAPYAVTGGISSIGACPIEIPLQGAGTTNTWYPLTRQRASYSAGYYTHVVTGLYKQASGAWGIGASGWFVAVGGNDNYPTEEWRLTYGGYITNSLGYVAIGGSARSPIFYDIDNTAYYVDAASTSSLNGLTVAAQITGSIQYVTGGIAPNTDNYMNFRVMRNLNSSSTDGMYIGYGNAGGAAATTRIFGGGATNGEMTKYADRTEEPGSFRAPIFYDVNNTAYYTDPATGTNLNGTLINNAGTAMTGGWNRSILLNATFPVIVFNSNNTKYSGIGVDYSAANAGFYFWVNGNSTDINNGSASIAMQINTGNFVTAAGSFRAPLFYDSDNTAYYVDPASTSNLNGLTVAATITGTITNSTQLGGKTEANLNVNNATSAGGLLVHAGRNNEVNKIVRTDGNGYIQAGWINTPSGDNGTTAITKVYASSDDYIRTYTPANFLTVLNVPTRSRAIAMSIIFG